MKKILLPIDGSKTANNARKFAIDTAKLTGAKVIVLSVVEDTIHTALGGIENQIRSEMKQKAKKIAEATQEKIEKEGIKAESCVASGKPSKEIVKLAKKEKVNHIVMGSQGLSGIARWVIGSVADGVIRQTTCPVTLVPSK